MTVVSRREVSPFRPGSILGSLEDVPSCIYPTNSLLVLRAPPAASPPPPYSPLGFSPQTAPAPTPILAPNSSRPHSLSY